MKRCTFMKKVVWCYKWTYAYIYMSLSLWFEKKNLQRKIQLAVYVGIRSYIECIIPFNIVQQKKTFNRKYSWQFMLVYAWNVLFHSILFSRRKPSTENTIGSRRKPSTENTIGSLCLCMHGIYYFIQSCSVEENFQHKIQQSAVCTWVYIECIIQLNSVQ